MKNHPKYSVGGAPPGNPHTRIRPPQRWSFAANFTLGVLIIVAVLLVHPLVSLLSWGETPPRHVDL